MRLPFCTDITPIGLDIGSRCVKAVQLARTFRGWRIQAVTLFAQQSPNIAVDGAAVARIAGILRRQGFRGHEVVLAAPPSKVEVGILELPPRSSGAPIAQIARAELARSVKVAPDTLAVDFWDVPAPVRSTGATHVMAVAYRHPEADALVDLFESQGLSPLSIDIHGWALARACAPQANATAGMTGILDIGWGGALLILLHQGSVIYQRTLTECGICRLRERIAEVLEVEPLLADHLIDQIVLKPSSEAERTDPLLWASIRSVLLDYVSQVSTELQASFSYASHRYPACTIDKLFLTGGGACIVDLAQQLSEKIGVATKPLAPAELVECPARFQVAWNMPALIPALGLAQYGDR